jgi:hypothetical protein
MRSTLDVAERGVLPLYRPAALPVAESPDRDFFPRPRPPYSGKKTRRYSGPEWKIHEEFFTDAQGVRTRL